ncbi:uncharacterized protein LOC116020604 [Ipomoea triloba]|uniref:uncharacterized protein LOC116020604 n=1 Tax=Ipomoea triloba TaxID=35885 RepID=UPI00125CF0B8|nr:uncharacterized protein LOC116020604 [Ipomoea triloba]XP_031116933.1 uncharacterized protein LOC116020604 [Ipomoea triloba]
MESNRHSPSVIARLMGLDEPLPPQPVYKQRRILSETYLRKSASIVLREKSSFSVGHSSSMNTKKRKAIKDAFEDNLPRYVQEENKLLDVRNFPSEYCLGHSAVCKSSSASKYRNNEICKKSDIMSEGNILSSLQELETGSVVGSIGDFETGQLSKLKSHFELKDYTYHPSTRTTVLGPSSVHYPKSDMEPPKQSFRVPFGTPSRRLQYARHYHVGDPKTKPVQLGPVTQPAALSPSSSSSLNNNILDRSAYSFSNLLFFTKESKRQMLEQWNLTKDFQEVEVDKGCSNPREISSRDGWKSEHSRTLPRSNTSQICMNISGNANSRSRTEPTLYGSCLWQKDDVRNENKCMKQSQKHYVELGDRRVVIPEKKSASRFYKCNPGLSNSESKSLAFTRNAAGSMANANTKGNGISFMNFENLHSEPSPCSLSTGDDLSSNSWEASFKQESLNESPPNRLVSLKDTIIDPNSTMNLKEAKQSSPISVLEPHFKARKLRNSECYDGPVVDLHSVVKQLKLLETSSEETYSEGSEMAVSSVENNEKRSFYFSQELLGVFSSEESRDFSYLVDVLDEAHLNFEVDFETCNSLESPINPLLFEALEKKYGKQISWLKSERRLLFDRINSWFSEILNSFTDIHVRSKSLKMMFHPTLRRSEVEEELWMLLVNEEKEVGKDLSEKALGVETKWLKMESEISNICKEVENYLFDELVAELFCI